MSRGCIRMILAWTLAIGVPLGMGGGAAWAETPDPEAYAQFFPDAPDPLMGDYIGRWSAEEEVDPDIAAQVIPIGRDRYRIVLVSKLAMRAPPLADVEVRAEDGRIAFEEAGLQGETDGRVFTGGRRVGDRTFHMEKVDPEPPTLGNAPPEGAVVLFDGQDLEAWENTEGWVILDDGTLMVVPPTGDIRTKQHFKDVKLHVEFRLPYMPAARGQARGNSGVFLQDTYEVQVLDSYGLHGYYDECGALYKVAPPKVNATTAPLTWQTYDIVYRAPRHNEAGEVVENPRMTVFHNGILIHNDQEMPWITGWRERDRLADKPRDPAPIRLQAHNNYVQFRNVWAVPLDEE